MKGNKVFLDSSVLIASVISQRGGSFYLLNKFKDKFEFQISEQVFKEVIEVLNNKFSDRPELKNKFFLILGWSKIEILPNTAKNRIKTLTKFLSKEDATILSIALKNSSYFITLDNDFLDKKTIQIAKNYGLKILKPKEFIESN